MVAILITGCHGQIGTALAIALRREASLTASRIIGADIHSTARTANILDDYQSCDVRNPAALRRLIASAKADWVFHLPAILSGAAEMNVALCRQTLAINVRSQERMLLLAQRHHFRLFCPSTIGAFGSEAPKNAPDVTIMAPKYLYGITKVYNELLGDYFFRRYQVDYRSLRLPGILSETSSAGTGTTDYAIAMIQAARLRRPFQCFLEEATTLPMVHIDDCITGIIRFMSCERVQLRRSVYNIQGMSFAPRELRTTIERVTGVPLTVSYAPDLRQQIADSWPTRLNDANARRDWGWAPRHTLESAVRHLLIDK